MVNARAAASIASLQSWLVAAADRPTTSPEKGLRMSNVAPLLAGRNSPSMRSGVKGTSCDIFVRRFRVVSGR